MIKAVIFDMDGTIIDSEPIYREVNQEIYGKYGFKLSQEDYDRHMGANLKDIWEDILERHQVKEEFSHYKVEDFMEDHIHESYQGLAEAEDLELMPGVKEWFEFLKDHGYKMIIASSSYAPVIEHVYQRFELDQYMEGYVDGNAIENGKPAPDIFLKAAEKMGVDVMRWMYCAQNPELNMRFGYNQADGVIKALDIENWGSRIQSTVLMELRKLEQRLSALIGPRIRARIYQRLI